MANKPKPGSNEYMRQYMKDRREKAADLTIPPCKNKRRRNKAEKDAALWLKAYLGGWFSKDFSTNQLEIIADLERRLEGGGMKAVAMDRGGGKTTIGKGMVLMGLLTGRIKFAFCAAATGRKAQEDFVKPLIMTMETNKNLIEDYPEACVPFVALERKAQRAASQTVNGKSTYISITGGIVFPTIDGSRCSGSVFKADGLTSAARGAQHTTAEGDIQRPDFIFFDDPQTDESASSKVQTASREKIIEGMVGMAGAGEKMAGYIACTVIEKDDLSSRFLNRKRHPEWYGSIYRMVNKWPACKDTRWEEYMQLRRQDMEDEDMEFTTSLAYYDKHFDEMNEGAEVAWDGRQFKGDRTAIQSAFHLVIEVGGWHRFMAEYQNDPIDSEASIYTITPELVRSRCNGLPRLHVPEYANYITGMGDINHVGINYAVIAFKNDFTGAIIDYGKFPEGREVLYDPKKSNQTTEAQAITKGIFDFAQMLSSKVYTRNGNPVRIQMLQIDSNYMTETVYNAVAAANARFKLPFELVCNNGVGYAGYYLPRDKKTLIRKGEYCDFRTRRGGRVLVQNSDYWRMTAQKAFLLDVGVPGGLSIFGNNQRAHERLSNEVCSEKLVNYAITDKGAMYKFNKNPTQANDLLDAITACFSAANTLGASLTGGEISWRKPKKRPRRQCRQTPQ